MGAFKEVFARTEIKYLLEKEQYEPVREYLDRIARVDEYGLTRINNIYFDTPDYRLIRTSLEKPVYKEKLRLRTYGQTTDDTGSFIEIKKKYKGTVYKRRISGRYADHYDYLTGKGDEIERSQIAGEIEQTLQYYRELRPAMSVCYDRIALAGTEDPSLRITFDTNITYDEGCRDLRNVTPGKPLLKEGQHLMEIKVSGGFPMEFARRLSELSVFPTSYSKYGSGYQDMMRERMLAARSREVVRDKSTAAAEQRRRYLQKGVTAYV